MDPNTLFLAIVAIVAVVVIVGIIAEAYAHMQGKPGDKS